MSVREIVQMFPDPDSCPNYYQKQKYEAWFEQYSKALAKLIDEAPTLGVLGEADVKAAYMDYYEGRLPTTEEIQAIEEYAGDHAESGNTWLWDVVDALNGKGDLPIK